MTRENKLALVVGFGLILFVGILISDHFSVVRRQEAATLGQIVDPTLVAQRDSAGLIDLLATNVSQATNTAEVAPAVRHEVLSPVADAPLEHAAPPPAEQPVTPQQLAIAETVQMGGPAASTQAMQSRIEQPLSPPQPSTPPGFVPVPEEEVIPVKVTFHDVRGGETLTSICRHYYGDGSLSGALAKFNKIDDPRQMRAGRRLVIPPVEQLGGKPKSSPQRAKPTPPSPKPTTYVVKAGENLSTISQRVYGTKSKWRTIYERNRDVIDDPNNVKVGTVLKL